MAIIVNKVKSLESRSSKAIGIFQKAIADLDRVNGEAEVQIEKREKQISKLQAEQLQLSAAKVKNQQFIDKLNEFLGID